MCYIGDYDREPIVHGASEAEYLAGINAANGALAALLVKEASGHGQHVDVSITECLTMMLSGSELPTYTYMGGVVRRGPKGVAVPGLRMCRTQAQGLSARAGAVSARAPQARVS